MSTTAVASEIHKTFNIHRYFAPAVTFYNIIIFNYGSDSVNIITAEIITVHLTRQISLI